MKTNRQEYELMVCGRVIWAERTRLPLHLPQYKLPVYVLLSDGSGNWYEYLGEQGALLARPPIGAMVRLTAERVNRSSNLLPRLVKPAGISVLVYEGASEVWVKVQKDKGVGAKPIVRRAAWTGGYGIDLPRALRAHREYKAALEATGETRGCPCSPQASNSITRGDTDEEAHA